jgi:ribosomal protein S8
MGRLKNALERKITKEEVLSPYDRWLGRKMEQKREENRKFDREMLEKAGLVFTKEGVMKKEEAKKRGLEEIEMP